MLAVSHYHSTLFQVYRSFDPGGQNIDFSVFSYAGIACSKKYLALKAYCDPIIVVLCSW